jgi:hypothetical protein
LPHIGLDGHLEGQSNDKEIATKEEQIHDNSKEIEESNTEIISSEDCKDVQHSKQVAEAAEATDVVLEDYSCYYCDEFKTNNNDDYERHVINKHGKGRPCYPSKADLER